MTTSARTTQSALLVLAENPVTWDTMHPLTDKSHAAVAGTLWEHSALFLANWTENVILRSTWNTDVFYAESLAEARRSLVSKPVRTLGYTLHAMSQESANLLQAVLARMSSTRFLAPLYHDFTELDAEAATGASLLSCPTSDRHFNALMRVLLARPDLTDPERAVYEIAHVSGVTANNLSLLSPLQNTWPSGTLVFPLIESRLLANTSADLLTDQTLGTDLQVTELEGHAALSTKTSLNEIPPATPFHDVDNLPIFDFEIDWDNCQTGTRRFTRTVSAGVGAVDNPQGLRPYFTFKLDLLFDSREEAYRLLEFFDSRGGRTYPFWLPSPLSSLALTSISTSSISVEAVGELSDWHPFRSHVCLETTAGAWIIRDIYQVYRVNDTDIVSFTAELPPLTLDQIRRVSIARRVRFASDVLEETWHNDSVFSSSVELVEVVNEQDITVPDLEGGGGGGGVIEEGGSTPSSPGLAFNGPWSMTPPPSPPEPCSTCCESLQNGIRITFGTEPWGIQAYEYDEQWNITLYPAVIDVPQNPEHPCTYSLYSLEGETGLRDNNGRLLTQVRDLGQKGQSIYYWPSGGVPLLSLSFCFDTEDYVSLVLRGSSTNINFGNSQNNCVTPVELEGPGESTALIEEITI